MYATAIATLALALARAVDAQTVTTQNGTIQGGHCASTNIDYFYSIPYAQPPVGDRRFAVAEPYLSSYNGTLNATVSPASCIQFGRSSASQSEDCLYLNVWKPAGATPSSKLPVKVWIYGGSNQVGSSADPTYNGCFSAVDAIVVSMNYRLGPLGYLALSSLGLSGNYAISDLLMAVRWVQDNIAAFGGDPSKVLVFGQSAGAFNTFVLATLPQAPNLMKAAAMESGAGRDYATVEAAQVWQKIFLDALGCNPTDLACARAASISDLLKAFSVMPEPPGPSGNTLIDHMGAGTPWGPLIDGDIVPTQPSEAGVKVPSIFGSTVKDGSWFLLALYASRVASLNESEYTQYLSKNWGPFATNISSTFPASKFSRTNMAVYEAMLTTLTDSTFKCPSYRGLLGAAKNGVPAWAYSFNHTPSCAWYSSMSTDPRSLEALGPTHTSEIPFVFNLTTHLAPPDGNCSFTDAEKKLAAAMSTAWTSMAANARPGTAQQWPQWSASTNDGVNINDAMDVGTVDFSVCADFWDGINSDILALATNTTTNGTTTPAPSTGTYGVVRGRWAEFTTGAIIALLFII
ncbi:alpha/beta-hydrolase [Thozetella sp. PMI_491]|nr:alpha/beta-hydrolase [Thozetella sp. PMI_491]